MDEWVLWMIAAGVLAVGEIATRQLLPRPDRRGRGALGRSSRWPARRLAVQWIVFIVGLARLAGWCCGRSRGATCARRRSIRTGTAALVGSPRDRARAGGRPDGGQVKIGGEIWSARSYDEDDVFEPGARVEVMKIEGATALVAE